MVNLLLDKCLIISKFHNGVKYEKDFSGNFDYDYSFQPCGMFCNSHKTGYAN